MENAKSFAAGLRELADFYERHPEMPIGTVVISVITQPETIEVVKALKDGGSVNAETTGSTTVVCRHFGPLQLRAYLDTNKIGKRTVTWECSDPVFADLLKENCDGA